MIETDEIKLHFWACQNPDCRRYNEEIGAGPPSIEAEIGAPITCLNCDKPLKLVRVETL